MNTINFEMLESKAKEVRRETIRLHGLSPETRIASSLSDVEIFVVLYYSGLMDFDPKTPLWEGRDRFIISKGHGGISLYPILGDLGFFDKKELDNISQPGSFFGSIPDCCIPGFETINGSLGHGLGVASGMAIGLKRKDVNKFVFVLMGDGELYEGSVWEAIMFAGHHRLNNLIAIVDANQISMLDYCRKIVDIDPIEEKFASFGWDCHVVDGHNVKELCDVVLTCKNSTIEKPKVIIARTIKGKGVPFLEGDSLCHIKSLTKAQTEQLLGEKNGSK